MHTCQSCSQPLKTNADRGLETSGARSGKYCHRCYAGGKFLQPDLTVTEMRELVRSQMVALGTPRFLTGYLTRGIPKLDRWAGRG